MPKQRRNYSGAERIAILREHLLDKVPICEVCEQHGLQPRMFYNWRSRRCSTTGAADDVLQLAEEVVREWSYGF